MSSPPICIHYAKGICKYNKECTKDHKTVDDLAQKQRVCKFHLRNACKFGDRCTTGRHTSVKLDSDSGPHTSMAKGTPPVRATSTTVIRNPRAASTSFGGTLSVVDALASQLINGVTLQTSEDVVVEAPRPFVDVHFFLDVSGSMSGSRIREAQQALIAFYDNLRPDDGISLYTFNHNVKEVVSISEKRNVGANFRNFVHNIECGGGTALWQAVSRSVAAAQDAHNWSEDRAERDIPMRHQKVVILTDGEDTTGGYEDAAKALRAPGIRAYNTFIVAVAEATKVKQIQELAESIIHVKVINAVSAGDIAEAFTKVRRMIIERTTEIVLRPEVTETFRDKRTGEVLARAHSQPVPQRQQHGRQHLRMLPN